uniref:Ankyrin repeat and SOCS box containing 5a n=1 Tax=Gadus morhua TaxID=8049 RepID=A0A8C5BT08_GADMO
LHDEDIDDENDDQDDGDGDGDEDDDNDDDDDEGDEDDGASIIEAFFLFRYLGRPVSSARRSLSGSPRGPKDPPVPGQYLLVLETLLLQVSTALVWFSSSHNAPCVVVLQGHEVDALTIHQTTPLHEACLGGHGACARALLDAGANVNSRTLEGSTPLFYACAVGSVPCAEVLLQRGARPGGPLHLPSPLHEASSRGHAGCVEVLLTWGADVDQVLPGQGTALYSACLSQELLCVQQLLRDGADVQRGRGLESPLHAAAQTGHAPITRLLLEFDADVQALNAEHQRAVELAPPGGSTETLLLAHEVTPTSLSRKCRQVVRCSVGHSRLHLLPLLPLPAPLTRYLLHR